MAIVPIAIALFKVAIRQHQQADIVEEALGQIKNGVHPKNVKLNTKISCL